MTKTQEVAKTVTPSIETGEMYSKEEGARFLQKMMQEETKLVKGRFRQLESPGKGERIQCKKYPTPADMRKRNQSGGVEPFDKYMVDGEVYEIPLYVARHLNGFDMTARKIDGKVGSCSYPVHGFKWDRNDPMGPASALGAGPTGEMGVPVPLVGINKRVRRFAFESLEFGTE